MSARQYEVMVILDPELEEQLASVTHPRKYVMGAASDAELYVYDTEPACRAVVAVRTLQPEKALRFKERVSTAFYAEGRDTTKPEVLADVAHEAGIERGLLGLQFLNA